MRASRARAGIGSPQTDGAAIGIEQAEREAHGGGFSRPIRPQQGKALALANMKAHAIDNAASVETFKQPLDA